LKKGTGDTVKEIRTITIIIVVLVVSAGLAWGLRNGIHDPFNGDQDTFSGSTGVSIILHYVDGAEKIINPTTHILTASGVTPLVVLETDRKEITKISYEIQIKLTWIGDLESYSLSGTSIKPSIRAMKDLDEPTVNTPSLTKGEWVTIVTDEVSATDINQIAQAHMDADGEIYFDIDSSVKVTTVFEDGATDSKSGTVQGIVKLIYATEPLQATGITSVDVSVEVDFLT